MQKLRFITADGVCGYIAEWDFEGAEWDAEGWLVHYGSRIGSRSAPLPSGGWIDLSQFATIQNATE